MLPERDDDDGRVCVVMVWNDYDGPISGLAWFRGRLLECVHRDDYASVPRPPALRSQWPDESEGSEPDDYIYPPRTFHLYTLSDDAACEYLAQMLYTEQCIGTHHNYWLPRAQRRCNPAFHAHWDKVGAWLSARPRQARGTAFPADCAYFSGLYCEGFARVPPALQALMDEAAALLEAERKGGC